MLRCELSGEQQVFSGEFEQQVRKERVCSTGNRAKAAPDTSLMVFQAEQQLLRSIDSTMKIVEGRHLPAQAAGTLNDEERRSDSEDQKKGKKGLTTVTRTTGRAHTCSARCKHSRGGEGQIAIH